MSFSILLSVIIAASQTSDSTNVETCLRSSKVRATWQIPASFRELSGMAIDGQGRMLIHGDEMGKVGVLDSSGKLIGSYSLGREPPLADFEDIAIADSVTFLVTSRGVLYEFEVPKATSPDGPISYTIIETGLGRICEIEGIAYDRRDKVLLIACKTMRQKRGGRPAIYQWSIAERRLTGTRREITFKSPIHELQQGKVRPSAIRVSPDGDRLIILSSMDNIIAITDRNGGVLSTVRLSKRHHQAEALEIGGGGSIYIGDEGATKPATVTVYACRS